LVNENLVTNFLQELVWVECKLFLGNQYDRENTHGLTYSLLLKFYTKDDEEYNRLSDPVLSTKSPSGGKKVKWSEMWLDPAKATLAERIIAFMIVERMLFCTSFAYIIWLKKCGDVPGLCIANDWILGDETLHGDFTALLSRKYVNPRVSRERVLEILMGAYECESEFCNEMLPEDLGDDMNAANMQLHLKFMVDWILTDLEYEPHFNCADTPFPQLKSMGLPSKNNMFERAGSSYANPEEGISMDMITQIMSNKKGPNSSSGNLNKKRNLEEDPESRPPDNSKKNEALRRLSKSAVKKQK